MERPFEFGFANPHPAVFLCRFSAPYGFSPTLKSVSFLDGLSLSFQRAISVDTAGRILILSFSLKEVPANIYDNFSFTPLCLGDTSFSLMVSQTVPAT